LLQIGRSGQTPSFDIGRKRELVEAASSRFMTLDLKATGCCFYGFRH
jgi:hypothetical protein